MGKAACMSTAPEDRTDLPGALGAGYAAVEEHRPLLGYAVLMTVFGTGMAGALVAARRTGRALPERFGVQDVLMAGIATQKLSRLITKDKVTGTVRAPFTRFQEKTGHGEVEEAARGRGLRYAIGELLVCPYCIAQWIAGAFTLGFVFAPRVTRLLSAMWTVHAVADAAQLAYSAAE
jgi:hypothetical protein